MIHESLVDQALNHLQSYFGKRVVVRPPAAATELAELESMVGALPRDLVIFLSTCNGLRLQIDDDSADEHLACIHEIERMLQLPGSPAALGGLIPLRGDPEGLCDWLVAQAGPLHGRVIRWGAWSPKVLLLTSSFGEYLTAWVDYLLDCFNRDGKRRKDRAAPDFDAGFIRKRNVELSQLEEDPTIRQWTNEFVSLLPSGADFE